MNESEKISGEPIEVVVEAGKVYWWCACGRSQKQPFCDGSHKGTGFTPVRYRASDSESRLFCVCKKTTTSPFCDRDGRSDCNGGKNAESPARPEH